MLSNTHLRIELNNITRIIFQSTNEKQVSVSMVIIFSNGSKTWHPNQVGYFSRLLMINKFSENMSKLFKCELCSAFLSSQDSLIRHLGIHKNLKGKRIHAINSILNLCTIYIDLDQQNDLPSPPYTPISSLNQATSQSK